MKTTAKVALLKVNEMKKEVVVPLIVLGDVLQSAIVIKDELNLLLAKLECLMDEAVEVANEPEVEESDEPETNVGEKLGFVKQYVVMHAGQAVPFKTREEAESDSKWVQEAWTDETVLKLIDLAKDYENQYSQAAIQELIKIGGMLNGHNQTPYSEASRVAVSQYHRSNKWSGVTGAKFKIALINMKCILAEADRKAKGN